MHLDFRQSLTFQCAILHVNSTFLHLRFPMPLFSSCILESTIRLPFSCFLVYVDQYNIPLLHVFVVACKRMVLSNNIGKVET